LNGAVDPDAGTGVDGDFYINNAATQSLGKGCWCLGIGTSIVGHREHRVPRDYRVT